MTEINSEDIPDDVLQQISDDLAVKLIETSQNVTPTLSDTAINFAADPKFPKKKKKQFADVTNDQVDEIAKKSNTKNTHSQTRWVVKIFKGNFIFILASKANFTDSVKMAIQVQVFVKQHCKFQFFFHHQSG